MSDKVGRVGDWEGDNVIGKVHIGVPLMLVEHKAMFDCGYYWKPGVVMLTRGPKLTAFLVLVAAVYAQSTHASELYQSYKIPMFKGSVRVPLVYEIDGITAHSQGCLKLTFANLKVHEYPIGSGSFVYTSCSELSISFADEEKYQLIDSYDVNGFVIEVYLYVGSERVAKSRIINTVIDDGEMVMMIGEKGKSFLIGLMESYDET